MLTEGLPSTWKNWVENYPKSLYADPKVYLFTGLFPFLTARFWNYVVHFGLFDKLNNMLWRA